MKTTALTEKHIALGAKMVPFAGFNMPVYYTGIIEEHNAVRNNTGIFDVSHMGEFKVTGPDALHFLQYITSNDVSKLFPGKVQYSCFPNDQGGIVDDLLVYKIADDDYLLVVNAANIDKDWEWVNKHKAKYNVKLENISDEIAQVAVQGPNSAAVLQPYTDHPLSDMAYYTFFIGKFAGIDHVIVSTTGYTGSGGFEIYTKNEDMPKIWDLFFKDAEKTGLKPIGLGARDTLRLEAGFCLYGNDINDTTSPIEAGLGWITKFSKDFIMKDYHQKLATEGVSKKLCGIELIDKGIARQHCEILNENNEVIGEITSGTNSPYTGKSIAMGYVKTPWSTPGTEIFISVRNKLLKAVIVKMPFFNKS
ncbi:MAG TPA: glycine cleavage system aminomethyltransferase GcvT [Bacteroidia bacterium]|nr:glycine cleavage system aminomethyltransferase GcvT [Bacteroidia bacterium]HRS58202.1 glycine cleavage system aminomethyltransferase GcvT [Bacteroidia bacterium]HRU68810.1 glycine cleavage system aminomethyltransferase GcvT [Bacteroidia bacterium]